MDFIKSHKRLSTCVSRSINIFHCCTICHIRCSGASRTIRYIYALVIWWFLKGFILQRYEAKRGTSCTKVLQVPPNDANKSRNCILISYTGKSLVMLPRLLILLLSTLSPVCMGIPESCWKEGQCLGHLIEARINIDMEDCAQACEDHEKCEWASHSSIDNACYLNKACYTTVFAKDTQHASKTCAGEIKRKNNLSMSKPISCESSRSSIPDFDSCWGVRSNSKG